LSSSMMRISRVTIHSHSGQHSLQVVLVMAADRHQRENR
jgi:hypothetical protein